MNTRFIPVTPRDQPRVDVIDDLHRHVLWGSIHRLAETDPALKDLLDRAVTYYYLKTGQ